MTVPGASLTYCGVGARSTPEPILATMTALAVALRRERFTLRSGHAPGADQAFERGAGWDAEVYLPFPRFQALVAVEAFRVLRRPLAAAYEIAAKHHPAWHRLSATPRSFHARNTHIVLGPNLDTPARWLLCWTPDGKAVGGTGQAIRVARAYGVEVLNLADPAVMARAQKRISAGAP